MKLITTSWDDGYPADIRLAELLGKYGMKGTFYIPRNNEEHKVMNENEIYELSKDFEIGGHTLNHKNLNKLNEKEIEYEVRGCFDWLKKMLSSDPVSFCPPYGKYSNESYSMITRAGFKVIRTTELLSPYLKYNIVPTTLQVFEHSRFTYLRHLLKRGNMPNLALWAKSGCSADIFRLLDHYMNYIELNGGCLHLWGHSWEIDEYDLWNKLELIFKHISSQKGFAYIRNMDLLTH